VTVNGAEGGRLVAANGVELWVEIDGRAAGPVVVLLGGADASVLRWPPVFVDALVGAGWRVVRIEHRDSGLSTKVPVDEPYRLEDLAHDVVGVLDALGLERAHLVGYSLGGAVAQVVALAQPARVASLTLVATTPGMGDERLPFAEDWFVERMAERLFAPAPRTADERVAWVVDLYRMLAGDRYPFDQAGQRVLARREVERSWYPESGHGVAATASTSRLDALARLTRPAVVVHGTRDPVYPLAHGVALASGLPGARLVPIDGLGHEIPAAFAPELAALVLDHLAAAEALDPTRE
jgi:pimeloyl-ACP methyl ester carboxylesterase